LLFRKHNKPGLKYRPNEVANDQQLGRFWSDDLSAGIFDDRMTSVIYPDGY
jgi:hypothetical protein